MITNEAGRAKKGGEIGLNGETYKGGQFLPSSEKTVKGSISVRIPKGTGKKEIAPYTWEVAPADDMLSIYDRITHCTLDNRRECKYIKGLGFEGFRFTEVLKTFSPSVGKYPQDWDFKREQWKTKEYSEEWIEFISGLMERFNAGERWYPLSEDPFHYLNNK